MRPDVFSCIILYLCHVSDSQRQQSGPDEDNPGWVLQEHAKGLAAICVRLAHSSSGVQLN
eukprot:4233838-Amphidinium_carterae.1